MLNDTTGNVYFSSLDCYGQLPLYETLYEKSKMETRVKFKQESVLDGLIWL